MTPKSSVHAATVLLLLMTIYFIISVAAEIVFDTLDSAMGIFMRLLAGALITGIAAHLIHIDNINSESPQ